MSRSYALATLALAIGSAAACARTHASAAPKGGTAPAGGSVVAPSATAVTTPGFHDETSIAIDPSNPRRMIAAWQVPATVAWTDDAGDHWASAPLPGWSAWELSGDPMVTFDADGHGYAVYIAFIRPDDYDTLGRAAHHNGIFLNRSDDGGRSWRATPTPVIEQLERPGIPFEDKPALAVDRTADSRRRGHVYVAWTEFRRHETAILFARSTDGGASFSPPLEISDAPGSPKDSVGADEGTSLAVGPDGTVYVVWSDSTGILIDRSSDGGRTFGRDVRIARTPDIVFGAPGVARANGYPSLGIDPRSGRLVVAWEDVRLGPPEPFVSISDDGGRTWSSPRSVAGERAADAVRVFAWMVVDARTGAIVLGYYRAKSPSMLEYVLARSHDGGRTFTEQPWGSRAFDPRGEFLGDYTGVDALGGTAVAAWTETAPGAAGGLRTEHHTAVVVGRARLDAP